MKIVLALLFLSNLVYAIPKDARTVPRYRNIIKIEGADLKVINYIDKSNKDLIRYAVSNEQLPKYNQAIQVIQVEEKDKFLVITEDHSFLKHIGLIKNLKIHKINNRAVYENLLRVLLLGQRDRRFRLDVSYQDKKYSLQIECDDFKNISPKNKPK